LSSNIILKKEKQNLKKFRGTYLPMGNIKENSEDGKHCQLNIGSA
jgi:hypothetical protein